MFLATLKALRMIWIPKFKNVLGANLWICFVQFFAKEVKTSSFFWVTLTAASLFSTNNGDRDLHAFGDGAAFTAAYFYLFLLITALNTVIGLSSKYAGCWKVPGLITNASCHFQWDALSIHLKFTSSQVSRARLWHASPFDLFLIYVGPRLSDFI